jgi:hypothetical protein
MIALSLYLVVFSLENKEAARQIKEDERKAGKHKTHSTDLVGYAKQLQEAISSGGIPAQQLQELKEIKLAVVTKGKQKKTLIPDSYAGWKDI